MTSTLRFEQWENATGTKTVDIDHIAGGSGLVPVVPALVTAVSGTASANSVGMITFSGCSAIQLDGVFSSKFTNYKIVYQATKTAATGDAEIFGRMVSGGTPITSGYLGGWSHFGIGTTTLFARGSFSSNHLSFMSQYYSDRKSMEINIYNPFTVALTEAVSTGEGVTSTSHTIGFGGGFHTTVASYDGFYIGTSGSTINGTVQVFGYRDN